MDKCSCKRGYTHTKWGGGQTVFCEKCSTQISSFIFKIVLLIVLSLVLTGCYPQKDTTGEDMLKSMRENTRQLELIIIREEMYRCYVIKDVQERLNCINKSFEKRFI